MKVLLVQPPFTILKNEARKCHPPLGLAYLAGALKDNFEVKILDTLAQGYDRTEVIDKDHLRYGLSFEDIEKRIIEFSPQVIGVSCLFSAQIENVQRIFQVAKKIDNRIITIVGGAHPTAVPEEVLKDKNIDFVIFGEGEMAIKKLLQNIQTQKNLNNIDVEGIGFKVDGRIVIHPRQQYQDNLDSIAFPYWDIFPLEKYFKINNPHGSPAKKIPYLPVVTSRGCPFNCIFCSIHTLWGNNYRKRSAENVLKELEYLVDNFGVKEILFEDDNLTLDKMRAKKIFQGIIDMKVNIVWSTPNGIAAQTLDDELLELMAQSGCHSISIGIESGDEYILKDIIQKPIVLSQVRQIINKAKKIGLDTTVFFVVGLPQEGLSHIKNTFRFAETLKADNVNFFFATPLPGTRLLKLCEEKGLVKEKLNYGELKSEQPYFNTDYISKEKLVSAVYYERLKLYLFSFLNNPVKFLYKLLRKLRNDPLYFLRFSVKYLDLKRNKNKAIGLGEKIEKTRQFYGFLWGKIKNQNPGKWHYNNMQETIKEPIVRGKNGIDIGSGCGYDTFIMANNNPSVKIISLDISEGVYKTKNLTHALDNVWIIKGSALNIPIADNALDFAYSYGVLHHAFDPGLGIREIFRVLKKSAPVYLYLYEDHSENRIKYFLLKLVTPIRKITSKIPSRILYVLSFFASPFVVVFFTFPHLILKRFNMTRPLSEKMPFNFGTNLFSLTGDLYDRFGAPIEHRFSRQGIFALLKDNGFVNISVDRMKATAGWVTRGYKE